MKSDIKILANEDALNKIIKFTTEVAFKFFIIVTFFIFILTRIFYWLRNKLNQVQHCNNVDSSAGNENNAFSINSTSGIISCEKLDREQKSEYFLVVTAEDKGNPIKAVILLHFLLIQPQINDISFFRILAP